MACAQLTHVAQRAGRPSCMYTQCAQGQVEPSSLALTLAWARRRRVLVRAHMRTSTHEIHQVFTKNKKLPRNLKTAVVLLESADARSSHKRRPAARPAHTKAARTRHLSDWPVRSRVVTLPNKSLLPAQAGNSDPATIRPRQSFLKGSSFLARRFRPWQVSFLLPAKFPRTSCSCGEESFKST